MRRRRRFAFALPLVIVVALVLALGVSTGSARSHKQSAAFKAAWIYVGPHDDHGWSQAHDKGRLYVQNALGSKVETTYKENVPEGPQTCQVIESLVRDGNKIIFSTSFGFQNCMVTEAKKYPDVYFEQATGTAQSKNLAEYFGRAEDAIYLSGMAAGAATKKGVLGYVVPFAIPEVIRHANAFALGAQATHPGAKVRLIWTNSWLDPAKEKKAAQSLVAAGADVLGQNVDSPATGQFAEAKGVPWVGYDSDAHTFAPKQWLTAAIYNWGPYYLRRVKAAMDGTWKTGFYYGSLNDKFVGLAPYGKKVSRATKAKIAAKKAALLSGKFYEFAGPLYDQKGKLRVKKGQRLSVKDLYAMNWLVKGVIGSAKG
jgi:basic membrane protein A